MLRIVRQNDAVYISTKQWAEILLLLREHGWSPAMLNMSYFADCEVTAQDASNIVGVGRRIQEKAMKNPLGFYPTVDMGKLAEFLEFCKEGAFSIRLDG